MAELTKIFAIEVLGHAIMDNHNHQILRNYPKRALKWTAEETAYRWRMLFPKRRDEHGKPEQPNEAEILEITQNKKRVEELRWRLCDISWFMRCLNENIARRANEEDEVTGRFWEGRFKCVRLDDDAAVMSAMVYVDLNPIRAGKATTPEESKFTSGYARIRTHQAEKRLQTKASGQTKAHNATLSEKHDWLCPIESIFSIRSAMTLEKYLTILDATGREVTKGKRGRIPEHLEPILTRLEINPEHWLLASTKFGNFFPRVAGSVEKMRQAAKSAGKLWFKGLSTAAMCF